MTRELRNTLETLEQRVAERTGELAKASEQMKYRATQLTTVAEVAHAITSIQEPDELLKEVTRLISERFQFYHVGIFLIDKAGEFAVLQAANSEGGQRMLARGHRLRVGQVGIVGYATGRGEPRVALDVGKDATFFDNPDLPYTRSEMALPLKVGQNVIGALDVQSMEQSAFSDEDVSLLSTLADQVAIAIQNSQLFTETRTALSELQYLHRQYIQQEWSQLATERPRTAYAYQRGKMAAVLADEASDVWGAIKGSDPTLVINSTKANGIDAPTSSPSLIAPITIRGEVIGVLNLAEPQGATSQEKVWSEDEINMVKSVADQVGLALENARLIEQTQRRAEREHLVSEITSKMRASNDPKSILETAILELKRALRAKQAQVITQPVAGSDQTHLVNESQPEITGNGTDDKPVAPPDDSIQSGGSE
jgi:GAF domain-containing protein